MSRAAAPRRKVRVLLVGPLPVEGTPIGGTQVSFAELVGRCRESAALEVDVVNTSRAFYGLSPARRSLVDARSLAATLGTIVGRGRSADVVMFNASSGAVLHAGPLVWAACELVQRPLVVRLFGGCFDVFHDRAPAWQRALVARTVMRAPLVLLQTRALRERFADVPGARWLPTTRSIDARPIQREHCRRFLFLSQLRPEKGIAEALGASDLLPAGCTLTVYGPRMPGTDTALFEKHRNAEWRGPLSPERIADTLREHDALVFPSYHIGEGLPGVVIEALQCGLPVVATRWRSLPELVEDGRNGLLVAPRCIDELARAMQRLASDDALYVRLCGAARASGDRFQGTTWQNALERWITELARGQVPGPDLEIGDDLDVDALSSSAACENMLETEPSITPRHSSREAVVR